MLREAAAVPTGAPAGDGATPCVPFGGAGADWLVWQLVDSAFPTGGYAHSNGLEAAWHHGAVRNAEQLVGFACATLQQAGRGLLPLVSAAHAEPDRLEELDQLCDAFLSNHVANRASRLQGRAFLAAATKIFMPAPPDRDRLGCNPLMPPAVGHFAPSLGRVAKALGLPRETTLRLFLFNQLRSLFSASVRLNIVGPLEAQRLQHSLSTWAEHLLETCSRLELEDIAQTAPLLDVWQGTHDRLSSRLFQS